MPQVYLSIGSNIDREHNIRGALAELEHRYGPLVMSRVYENAAVGFDGDAFYNLVVGFSTDELLEQLESTLDDIEQQFGRRRGEEKFAPRTLDLDLLLYGSLIRHDDQIDLPRDEIGRYAFVLLPLSEIAGEVQHPETGIRFDDMWQAFADKQPMTAVEL